MTRPGPFTSLHLIGQVLRGYLNDQIKGVGSTDLAYRLALALRGDTDLSSLLEELDDCFPSKETAERLDVFGAPLKVKAPKTCADVGEDRLEEFRRPSPLDEPVFQGEPWIVTVEVPASSGKSQSLLSSVMEAMRKHGIPHEPHALSYDSNPTSHPARGWCYDVIETDEGTTRTIWGAPMTEHDEDGIPQPLGDLLDPALKGVAAWFTERYGILHPEDCDGSPLDYDSLDPGIRDVVKAFHAAGIPTTDSGDGISKGVDPDITPFPHVVVPSRSGALELDANKVRDFVRTRWADAALQPSLYEQEDGEWGAVILVSWPAEADLKPVEAQMLVDLALMGHTTHRAVVVTPSETYPGLLHVRRGAGWIGDFGPAAVFGITPHKHWSDGFSPVCPCGAEYHEEVSCWRPSDEVCPALASPRTPEQQKADEEAMDAWKAKANTNTEGAIAPWSVQGKPLTLALWRPVERFSPDGEVEWILRRQDDSQSTGRIRRDAIDCAVYVQQLVEKEWGGSVLEALPPDDLPPAPVWDHEQGDDIPF